MIARVVTGQVDPSQGGAQRIRERLIPALQGMRGYKGGYWLNEPSSNNVVSVVLWESEADMGAAYGDAAVREITESNRAGFRDGPHIATYEITAQG